MTREISETLDILIIRKLFKINFAEETCLDIALSLEALGHRVRIASAIWGDQRSSEWNDIFEEIVSESDLIGFDAVYFEGGYQTILQSNLDVLAEYVADGKCLILADCSRTDYQETTENGLTKVSELTGSKLLGDPHGVLEVENFFTISSDGLIRLHKDDMDLSGIPLIVASDSGTLCISNPLVMSLNGAIPLLTSSIFDTLVENDIFLNSGNRRWPIASLNQVGKGYVACVTGNFSHPTNYLSERGNTAWLASLIEHTTYKQQTD